MHNENLKVATGVSYLTLVCHEDTWTFMAILAFGTWKPTWTDSVTRSITGTRCPTYEDKFTQNPNLPDGRITKLTEGGRQNGMQKVILSGHNLAQLLVSLQAGSVVDDATTSACSNRLYRKLVDFVDLVDPDAEAGKTTGITFRIDDSIETNHVQ
ncbi:hypothetical protein [Streptomyces sp. NBC_01497]|uniref:hypothetical protein n=1 Tax=Streptomyces sp. NBC_01497 TaxID=2903885 RepID=UPI002E32474C|nr:hypothetical protein [Streptomyces sp. NBC_01497]